MGLLDVIRSAVVVADGVTKELQPFVTLKRMTGHDAYGAVTFGTSIQLQAIVDWKRAQVRTSTGELTVSRATVLFVNVAQLMAATNNEGIGDEDQIILPDGTTGPILDISGFVDAGTGKPFATEVLLG